jgi:diguanylate cyclase (GGDEF)-like protein/PAS domain S-box-containing protein
VSPAISRQEALDYIRAKVDQLLGVMGTLPLRPEELDDSTLVELDPIGIVAESFRHIIAHLNETNHSLSVASAEIRGILDTLGAAVVVLDREGRIEDCNWRACDWLFAGAERGKILGRPAAKTCRCAAGADEFADGVSFCTNLDGRDLEIVTTKIFDEDNRHAKTVALFADITEHKRIERNLRLYSETFSHLGEGIVITDADKHIVDINAAVSRITGFEREVLIGSTPSSFKSGLHDAAFYDRIWSDLEMFGQWQGEILDRARDGRIIPLLETISAVRDGDGRVSHYIAVMADISSIKEVQTRLDFLAHHDVLTGLPNRLLFTDRLDHAIQRARREGSFAAVLFIDLDHFKDINDGLGHHVGDQLLVGVARRLAGLVRRADTVARLGGDEFVVLIEDAATHGVAANLAEKILAAFREPISVGGADLHVGCSIGVSIFPEDGSDAATLLKNADAAMYRAKEKGRHGQVRYSEDLSQAMLAKLELDNALRVAVRDGGFELHYQPIVDIGRPAVIACEALIRWPGGPAGARTPDRFISLAEETRLIVPLGEWILRRALSQMREWRAADLGLEYVSVNISAVQLAEPDFADRVIGLLGECGVAGRDLQIELTENVLMRDVELCRRVLDRLRGNGVRIAIDDFGTGYSSLSYLKQLPIDNLKIDRSFVRDIPGDPDDCAIAAAVIGLARTLWLDAIAEGIENEQQREYLAGIGCSKVQGFLYSRPLPPGDFAAYLRSGFPATATGQTA